MKKREMIITIGKDGGVNIEVSGVPGGDCVDFSKFLEEELGEVVDRQKTAEYFQEDATESVKITLGDD